MTMDVKDFDYELPEELIAQDPLEDRSASRLMVLDRETGEIQHRIFKDITQYLRPGDCLVINDTKVIPARLFGVKKDTGAKIEDAEIRSEEHTSELRHGYISYAVFCLKKKNIEEKHKEIWKEAEKKAK